VRTRASEIAKVGRNTQGVTLIRLPAEETLVGVVAIESLNADEDDAGDADAAAAALPSAVE